MSLEKIVILKLNEVRELPTLPKGFQKDTKRPLQSEFREGTTDLIRGFNPVLERILLPDLIGLSANDVYFSTKAREYWADFTVSPTLKGIKLNIGTEKKTIKSENGGTEEIDFPVNANDYMTYQIAMQSSKVAKTPEDFHNIELFPFSLIDLIEEQKKQEADFDMVDKADMTYTKLVNADSLEENELKINAVLELMRDKKESLNVETLPMLNKKMMLRNLKEKEPKKFISTVEDPNLSTKALITRMHNYGVLTKEGKDYYDGDVNLGEGKAIVSWFTKPENSGKVLALQSRLTSAIELKRN